MGDWDQFLQETPWFVQPDQTATVGQEQPWPRGEIASLPHLSALLASATLTPVSIADTDYELIAWGPPSARQGWLCRPPLPAEPTEEAHPIHRDFWSVCGGIIQQFREPDTTWWLNQDEILTATASQMPVSEVLADYSWLWEDNGLTIPIQLDKYYVVASEANGNLTLVHRESGQLLLFAPDHAFDGVTTLPGCPPYSLLTIDDTKDLGTWIEQAALKMRSV
ncbi:hypothetical protein FE257_001089 [Aspergillus nanangensis]|uniref:Uncharacterized protein n=1 Tax=Aspergillus nanangensis TaxID=2582783 RepID=A0AAD4CUF0_ASPNN|nr:hypothetical protein FE257_001089 [Aspergillus nanangensis]